MTVNPSAHLVSIEETEEDIRLHWRFTALMPVDRARQRLQDYFAQLGYALVASENNTLIMQRGSGTLALDWSPRSKNAAVIAHFTPSKSRTGVAIELRLYDDGDYEAVYRLHAWELVEVEQYLHGEPVNFEAMKRFNHHLRMQAFRASARGFATGLLLAAVVGLILHSILTDMGIEKWLRNAIVGAVVHMIVFWQVARAMKSTLGSRKR